MERSELTNYFQEKFGNSDNVRFFFSPGRVNLIGEHIDYNGGLVFPCAINKGIYAAARKNSENRINLYSLNFPALSDSFDIDKLDFADKDGWQNYPKGVLQNIFQTTGEKSGLDIVFYGNLPDGTGLSSSACLEMLTAVIAKELLNLQLSTLELVKLCQTVENNYIGVKCGIMDQFAVGFGKKNQALLLDCASLGYSYAPFETQGYSLVITNSNKRRELADSKYNERRIECESALNKLKRFVAVENLCQVSEDELYTYKKLLTEVEFKRAMHVVTENQRTIQAAVALRNNDFPLLGQLMNSSHLSLKDNYQVTGKELDCLVINAQNMDFVLGSRMTGAGFGGCVISLICNGFFDEFSEKLGAIYQNECGLKADFYRVEISDGAGEI